MTLTSEEINELLLARVPAGAALAIPPPCLLDMQGEVLDYEEGASLRVRFPVLPRYRNPMGNMQGGFIVAAMDNTLGPFAYLIAPPSVTVSLNTQYLRPVSATETFITCSARVMERTRGTLHLAADARGSDDKVVAMCQSVCQIVTLPPAG